MSLRFAILRHDHPAIHWDLMLQDGAILKTWRLAEPFTPDRDIPAEAIGDHRLAYLDYEGRVSGNRGQVNRVLGGTLEWRQAGTDLIELILDSAEFQGSLVMRRTPTGWIARFIKA